MEIVYREIKDFSPSDLEDLFLSVNWESGKYPKRLTTAMRNSSEVISAWDGTRLVGLVRGLDDGATVAFLHYLLVRPEYQKHHIGRALMQRILKKYEHLLYIKIMPSDPNTIKFYEKFGFKLYPNYAAMVIKNFNEPS